MKHIVKLNSNRFIHLDSYYKNQGNSPGEALVFIVFTLICAISIGGLIGADITHFSKQQGNTTSGVPLHP